MKDHATQIRQLMAKLNTCHEDFQAGHMSIAQFNMAVAEVNEAVAVMTLECFMAMSQTLSEHNL